MFRSLFALTLLLAGADTFAAPAVAPALPAPKGRIVHVASEPELQNAVRTLRSNTTVLIAPGVYALSSTLHVNGDLHDIVLRGATDNRDDVVLVGPGMSSSPDSVPNGIWMGNGATRITIANLTVREFPFHCIILNAGTQAPRFYNLRLVNAGQQIIKSNPDGMGRGVDHGTLEYSVLEFTTTSLTWYTNGVDVLGGKNWRIRHNLFRNIRAPHGQLAGPAVLMWRGAAGTITEGNTFIDCQRAIAYGLESGARPDHSAGIIRNNFIVRRGNQPGDAGIILFSSPDTVVAHNTVLVSGTYPAAIEYRFRDTTRVRIVNNLTDAAVVRRDGAAATLEGNFTAALPDLFEDTQAGNLHLRSTARVAIDQGVTIDMVSDDWDGEGRAENAPDIGADELTVPTRACTCAE